MSGKRGPVWIAAAWGCALGSFTFLVFTHHALFAADWCAGSAQCLRDWTAALSGWVAAIVAGATVIVLVATLKQMRRASEVQTQAYVYASRAKFGDFNNILIWCRNTGLTPATHFTVNGEAGIVKQGTVSSSISFSNHGWKTWTALGASDELSVGIDTDPETVRRFRSGETERDVVLMVCGQIVYCTVDNHDHVTQFVFYVDAHNRTLFRRPTNNVKSFHRVAAA